MPQVEKRIGFGSFFIIFQFWLVLIGGPFLPFEGFAQQSTPSPTPATTKNQPPETDSEIIKVNTNLIQIEAIVKDKNGKPVTELTADDFELVEGDRVLPIDFFSYVPLNSDRQTIDAVRRPLTPHQLKRTFVFIVSNPLMNYFYTISTKFGMQSGTVNSSRFTMAASQRVSKFLNQFFRDKVGKNDLVSVIDTEADLGLLSNFTNDRQLLEAAVNQISKNASDGKYPTILANAHITETSVQRNFDNLISQNLSVIKVAHHAVEQLKNLPGRKVVILLSRGLLRDSAESLIVRDKMKTLIEQSNQAQVTFYALHLNALGENLGALGQLQDLDSMKYLAEATGGRAITNTNDVSVGFDEILNENNGYYLLAYNADGENISRPHQLTVRLKRPDLKAQTRSTFYKNETAAGNIDKKEKMLRILRSPFTYPAISVELSPAYQSTAKKQGNIKTTLRIDPAMLAPDMMTGGLREVKLDLGLQVIAPDNKLVRQDVKNFTLKLSEESWSQIQKEGLVYQFDTGVNKPGHYQIKVAVCLEKSNQCGSVSRFLETGK